MYSVGKSTAWCIQKDGEIHLEVTSDEYAHFLCEKMNNGATLDEIKNRQHPDVEFIRHLQDKYAGLYDMD